MLPEVLRTPFARSVAIPLLLTLLTAVFFWRLTFSGETLYWGTPLLQFYPWRSFAVQEYLSGRVPLWNPYAGFGAPLAANFQSAVFYPLNFFYFLIPIEHAMSVTVLLHVFLAGWFVYGYTRMTQYSQSCALVAALTFMFSGYLIARAGFLSITSTVAWLPAELLAMEGCLRSRNGAASRQALWVAALAGATAMTLLAGHIQIAYYSLVAAALYLAYQSFVKPHPADAEPRVLSFGRWKAAAACGAPALLAISLGIALAAIQLVPSWELVGQSVRQSGAEYELATGYSLWPGQLLGVLIPNFFGSQAAGDWRGPGAYWEGAIYLGTSPFLLALLGARHGKSRLKRFWLVLALVALFLALGRYNPLFPVLFQGLPGLGLFQAPARFCLWYTLALAMLAGLGWDALVASTHDAGRRLGAWAIALGVGMLIAAASFWMTGLGHVLGSTSVGAVAMAGAWLVVTGLLLSTRDRWSPGLWRGGALVLLVGDLFLFGMPLNPTTDPRLYTRATPDSVAALHAAAGDARTYVTEATYRKSLDRYFGFKAFFPADWQELSQVREALVPNIGTAEGISEVYNYDPLRLERAQRLQQFAEAQDLPDAVLDLMGVRYVLSYDAAAQSGKLWGQSGPVTVFERTSPLPRAFVVPEAITVPSNDAALREIASSSFNPRQSAVVEAPPGVTLPVGQAPGTAQVVSYTPQRVILQVTALGGVLVLADAFYPGWKAKVGNQEVAIWPTDAAFRGIIAPPGSYTVEFWYDPESFHIGLAVSSVAMFLLLLLVAYGLIARGRTEQRT